MAGERERRRLGKTIGTEVLPRIDRLFGGVEQQHATRSLGGHHANGVLGHRLVSEEVELEAPPQNAVGHAPDPPLPRRSRVGYHDVEAAERPTDPIEGPAHRAAFGDVTHDPDGASADDAGNSRRGRSVPVENRDGGASRRERASGRRSDPRTTPGYHHDLPRQRRLRPLPELRLLQRPVLDVEHVGLADRPVTANRFGIRDDLDGVLRDVGHDARIARRSTGAEQTEPGDEDHARIRVELDLGRLPLAVVTREVGVVTPHVPRHPFPRFPVEGREVARKGRRQDQGPVLGADRVIGRRHADLAVATEVLSIDVGPDALVRAEVEDDATPLPARVVQRLGEEAADHGTDLGNPSDPGWQARWPEPLVSTLPKTSLRQRHQGDHPFICAARGVSEREDSVLEQDQAFDAGVRVVNLGRLPGQGETGHDVGHERDAAAEDLAAERVAVGLVGHREHGGGVGVIDVLVRQERMQQRLHRRVGRRRVEQAPTLQIDHLPVGKRVETPQLEQRGDPQRRKTAGLDVSHVPAAALDAQHVDAPAEGIPHGRLDRGVAPAVQHEPGIPSEQARGVNAQRQIAIHPPARVGPNQALGFSRTPPALHACPLLRQRAAPTPDTGTPSP